MRGNVGGIGRGVEEEEEMEKRWKHSTHIWTFKRFKCNLLKCCMGLTKKKKKTPQDITKDNTQMAKEHFFF